MFSVPNTLDRNRNKGQESGLEWQLIYEYLLSKGYRESDLQTLPEEARKALMKEACLFAALRLANIEAKAKFRQTIKLPDR